MIDSDSSDVRCFSSYNAKQRQTDNS